MTARIFMRRFMLRGLMSLKYDDLPKHLDKSPCDGCRSRVVLPKFAVDDPGAALFVDKPFAFFPRLLPVPALPISVSDM